MRNELAEEHLNPHLHSRRTSEHAGDRALGAPPTSTSTAASGSRSTRSRTSAAPSSPRPSGSRRTRPTGSSAAASALGLDEAERWDTRASVRAPAWDTAFPKATDAAALEGTLADLGVDLRAQQNVHLDVEHRPHKSPRAFCAPIEVPGRVMLVIQPIGGPDDWRALFHEAGHTEHFAHTSPTLPMEERRLGDNAVTEGWAMLLEHLVDDPAWLAAASTSRGRSSTPPRARRSSSGSSAATARSCCTSWSSTRARCDRDAPRYVELLGDALKIEPSPTDYLADIDAGFYASSYLRAWAFEAQLRATCARSSATSGSLREAAGSLLRELWTEGQSRRPRSCSTR